MKDAFKSFLDSAKSTGSMFQEKASTLGQAAVDNTVQTIEKWLEEFPKIESYDLKVTNFSFVMRISPSLEVELRGKHESFSPERLVQILAENKSSSLTGMIFTAVKTTYRLHNKIASTKDDPLIVKIRLAISPEIAVFIGAPKVV